MRQIGFYSKLLAIGSPLPLSQCCVVKKVWCIQLTQSTTLKQGEGGFLDLNTSFLSQYILSLIVAHNMSYKFYDIKLKYFYEG